MSPEEAAKWSTECKKAVTELGFCLLQGMFDKSMPGAKLDPKGDVYNCDTQTDKERLLRHRVPESELVGCARFFDWTRERQDQATQQFCLDKDCNIPIGGTMPLRP